MAYVTKYQALWAANGKTGTLYIQEDGFIGEITTIKLLNDAIKLTREFSNWESHLNGITCEFNLADENENYFELFDLLIAKEYKYKIRVDCVKDSVTTILFSGFINTEAVSKKYLRYQAIRLVASTFIGKLEYVHPTTLDTVRTATFIDVIIDILKQTKSEAPIRVLNSGFMEFYNTYNAAKTFMNQNGLYTELFWENNIERASCEKVLESILVSFNAYFYYLGGYWYIERYNSIGLVGAKKYVEYSPDSTYSTASTGTVVDVTLTEKNLHDDLQFIELTQTIQCNPGKRQVVVKIQDSVFYNLTQNILYPLTRISADAHPPNQVIPPIGKWYAFQPTGVNESKMLWVEEGVPYLTMVNSVKRRTSMVGTEWGDYPYRYAGLITSFVFTFDKEESEPGEKDGDVLNIEWSFGYKDVPVLYDEVIFQWTLDIYRNDVFIGVLVYDNDDALWRLGGTNEYTRTSVAADTFNSDKITNVSIAIPLYEVKDYAEGDDKLHKGTFKARLKVMTERFRYQINAGAILAKKKYISIILDDVYYGDFRIHITKSEYADNFVEGTTNDSFIEKQEISMMLADMPNFNYKNAILTGDNLEKLSLAWDWMSVLPPYKQLIDWILIEKFRIGNVTRQRINGRVRSVDLLIPFTRYKDNKQNKVFLLTGFTHDVNKDEYQVILDEYDTTTVINLIEE